VVLIRDPEWLAPKKGKGDGLARAREAWRSGRRKEGARRLLALASRAGWGLAQLEKVSPADWKEELNVELAEADLTFLQEVITFCREERITAPEGDDSALLELLKKGVPKGHALVIAATEVDSKSQFLKQARVVERKVAAKLKDLDLSGLAAELLKPFGKKLAPGAEALLKDRCGGNIRLIQSELEKLALYASGPSIQPADVELLVQHVREEEYLELSDALQKRDLPAALRYAREALSGGAHPLIMLGAIGSIVRTLLQSAERLQQLSGGRPPRSFDDFKARIFPEIEREAKAGKGRVPHPYAAFMGMQSAARFGRAELLKALVACAEADLALKLGGGPLVVERLLWTVCGSIEAWDSQLHVIRREQER
jgi:DNA polymerase-3 subunit delta